ncbi:MULTISPECIES: hypothetical protein [unclassified Capnocytophaga]|jgi:hypothetical protein|uniref:hypothetical protein n=1 Tax=unclassified Capnocytophaga TaxID=2640652 RepID=UPI000202F119|nr:MULTISPECIES: hypothetical protein [unclassified Capnocytophaga]EGD34724.1 tetratricopeptide repeat-containing domain protein [Capnocytophaga sp. oral taxon 338 str. F0234]MEB3004683.1 hypothetical protein [Capnocytophaga sp. G2]
MKKILLLSTLSLAVSSATYAQKEDCQLKASVFVEAAKVKNYNEAYQPWKFVYETCPELYQSTFLYGERILKDRIAKGTDKAKYVKDLQELYHKFHQYFPQKFSEAEMNSRLASLLIEQNMGTKEELFSLLDKTYKLNKDSFTDDMAIYQYFATVLDLKNEGKKTMQDVFDVYDNVSEIIENENDKLSVAMNQLLPKEEANTLSDKEKKQLQVARIRIENLKSISENVDAKIGQLADCKNLIPLYQKNYEANKNDTEWLRRAAGRMSDKECTADPLFAKLVERLYQLAPSASSALYLGIMKEKQKNTSEAVKYFNQAVDLEKDPLKKANYLVKIATKYSGSTAVGYAQKALSFNPSNASAYQVIAKAYASSANECGTTSFEKRAVYWLAANTARKGGLEKLAAHYEKLAPSRADIFKSGLAGKTITFKCWIGQSVKVPQLQ